MLALAAFAHSSRAAIEREKVMKSCCRNYSSILFTSLLVIGSLFAGVQTAGAGINPVPLPDATCPSNLNSCTANDVVTTVKAVETLGTCLGGSNPGTTCTQNGGQCTGGGTCKTDLCASLTDTIRLRITNTYQSTSNERYDLGLFVSKDGGSVQEPSSALLCAGAAAQAGQGDSNAYPDADTDLFLSLDPTGHANTPSTTDTCGDLSATIGPVDWTVDVAVACNIVNNQLIIPSCRVWEQNANHKVSCQTLEQAGTGSKCDCTPIVVTAQLDPCATKVCNDNDVCTNDSCVVSGTPGNLVGTCVYTPGNAGTVCRESAGVCDVADTCDGTHAGCTDVKQPATTLPSRCNR